MKQGGIDPVGLPHLAAPSLVPSWSGRRAPSGLQPPRNRPHVCKSEPDRTRPGGTFGMTLRKATGTRPPALRRPMGQRELAPWEVRHRMWYPGTSVIRPLVPAPGASLPRPSGPLLRPTRRLIIEAVEPPAVGSGRPKLIPSQFGRRALERGKTSSSTYPRVAGVRWGSVLSGKRCEPDRETRGPTRRGQTAASLVARTRSPRRPGPAAPPLAWRALARLPPLRVEPEGCYGLAKAGVKTGSGENGVGTSVHRGPAEGLGDPVRWREGPPAPPSELVPPRPPLTRRGFRPGRCENRRVMSRLVPGYPGPPPGLQRAGEEAGTGGQPSAPTGLKTGGPPGPDGDSGAAGGGRPGPADGTSPTVLVKLRAQQH